MEMGKVSGKGAMVFLEFTKDGGHEQIFRKIKELQMQKAQAILFLVKDEDLDLLAPYITYPSYFPPKLDEKLKKREKEGHPVQPLIEASKVAARAIEPDFPIHVPVAFIPYSQAEAGWVKDITEKKDASLEVHLGFKEVLFKDANIIGIVEGHDPEKNNEFLALGAHYDHLGKDEKSGFYYSGADDNGSGVSALLEIGRSLMKMKTDLRRSALLVFFGGEEWGLWGSRHFVSHPFVPLKQIKAMFSLDTIGGITGEKEIFFVGGSIHPSLAQRCRRFMEPLGIKEGRNIDRHSFEFGSDHYPFHQMGIPAVDLFASDYRKMHTSHDRPESIDFEKLNDVTRLIYLTAYEFLTEP
jgi:acetylornithine deacetylase/succinyl-diaminopimelate desuccinylase-like protein